MLLGTSGHLVQPCETDPMGQGSLLAVFAYGGLTFRLRFAYGPDSYLVPNPLVDNKWNWRWSLIISKVNLFDLRQPYGCGALCMTYVKPYGYLMNCSKKLTTGMNSSKQKMWPIHMEFRTLLKWPKVKVQNQINLFSSEAFTSNQHEFCACVHACVCVWVCVCVCVQACHWRAGIQCRQCQEQKVPAVISCDVPQANDHRILLSSRIRQSKLLCLQILQNASKHRLQARALFLCQLSDQNWQWYVTICDKSSI